MFSFFCCLIILSLDVLDCKYFFKNVFHDVCLAFVFGHRVSATRYILPSVRFGVNDLIDKYIGVLHRINKKQRKSAAQQGFNPIYLFSFYHFSPCGSHFYTSCSFFSSSGTLFFSSARLPAVLIYPSFFHCYHSLSPCPALPSLF